MAKIIAITGAGAGLGRALAQGFAASGDTVVLLGRTLRKVEEVAALIGGTAMAVACDVASPDSVRFAFAAIAERHPQIDVLINNAAIFEPFTIAEATDAQLVGEVSTNLLGPMLCARAAIPMMTRGGHIINVGSESVEQAFPHLSVYRATKAGLELFSTALSQELDSEGIRVSCVRAGAMHEEGKTWDIDPAAARRFHEAATAAGIVLRDRAMTHVRSAANIFRAIIDLPEDLRVGTITLHARKHES